MSEEQVLNMIKAEPELVELLTIIETLSLKEGCLCAGAIRNTVWNHLSHQRNVLSSDIDVIFFDPEVSYEATLAIQAELQESSPAYEWEVKNQVYMHQHHPGAAPYTSVVDALAHFPENCTAVAVRKIGSEFELIAPYGVKELLALEVKPTLTFANNPEKLAVYQARIRKKNWSTKWPDLKISLT